MARMARLIPELGYLHLTIRGNNKRGIFRKAFEYTHFKKLLLTYKKKFGFLLFHYVLMRNHIHLAVRAGIENNISKMMQGLQLAYGNYHRKRHDYVGYLWQGRFQSKIISDDGYLLTAGLYIERNPVKAKIVENPFEYPWSSYRYYIFGEEDPLIDADPVYLELGREAPERQKIYRELMAISIDKMADEESPHSLL